MAGNRRRGPKAKAVAPVSPCANCGAPLSGAYCAACGQARDTLNQSIFALASDWLGDVFSWDGRVFRTLRGLFARPGRLALDYVEGKRASYTPPLRLFLLATVILIAAMAALDMRLVSIQLTGSFVRTGLDPSAPENRPKGSNLWVSADVDGGTAFAALKLSVLDRARGARPIGRDHIERVRNDPELEDAPAWAAAAIRDPKGVEDAVMAAATQALFIMVLLFAVLNFLVHPRRRAIHHLVHSLYFHAALLLVLAPAMAVLVLLPVPREALTLPTLLLVLVALVAFDRGGYGTSALGLVWRIPVLFLAYLFGLAVVQLGFTWLMIPG